LLEAHHLESWFLCPDRRYDPTNGTLIHRDIHRKFHQKFGAHTTTKQFEFFCSTEYNISTFPWQLQAEDPNTQNFETFETFQEKFQNEMLELISRRGYKYVSGNYENRSSIYEIFCPKHDFSYKTSPHSFKRAEYGMPCCARRTSLVKPPSQKGAVRSEATIAQKKATDRAKQTKFVENLIQTRGHEFVSGVYETRQSIYKIRCPIHEVTHTVKMRLYCEPGYNLPCCRR